MNCKMKGLFLALFVAVPLGCAVAGPRSEWPNPSMSNSDLRKSCSAEASRVYRGKRGFRTDRAQVSRLRRKYRRACVRRVKEMRGTVKVLGSLQVPSTIMARV